MAVAPRQVAAAYTAPALHHFADLLSQGGRSASIASRSLPSLLKVRYLPWHQSCSQHRLSYCLCIYCQNAAGALAAKTGLCDQVTASKPMSRH